MKKLLQELLKDLNESIERHPKSSTFLCPLINNDEELYKYFISQMPTEELHPEFYNHNSFIGGYVWWDPSNIMKARNLNIVAYTDEWYALIKECNQERVKFIEKLISIN